MTNEINKITMHNIGTYHSTTPFFHPSMFTIRSDIVTSSYLYRPYNLCYALKKVFIQDIKSDSQMQLCSFC